MRFLIVDDDQSILDYMKVLLEPYGQCDTAISGEVAQHLFEEALSENKPYSSVFMDILMPGMDGHEAIDNLREIEKDNGIWEDGFKLIMITSLVDNKNVTKAYFEGNATSYLVKPFDRERILDELKANKII